MKYSFNLEKLIYVDGSRRQGLQIKSFRTLEQMYEYLNKQPNNGWQISCRSLKTGTYVYADEEWRNIKTDEENALSMPY